MQGGNQNNMWGFTNLSHNDNADTLLEKSLELNEGMITKDKVLSVTTGKYTGRSAKDKFIVKQKSNEDKIWWSNNSDIDEEIFDILLEEFVQMGKDTKLFVQDLVAGADEKFGMNVRVYTQLAWHALFIQHLLRQPETKILESFVPELTVINLPKFIAEPKKHKCRSDAIIAVNLERGIVLIGGTEYSGEIKKSVFSVLNYILPEKNVMPMHCSANENPKTNETTLFFGLSGTGKTTLSADSSRTLIGDDEHGWSKEGIYNFEGGCYAKTLGLTQEAEPEIFAASKWKGAILENVKVNENTKIPEFDNDSITQNGRLAYPIDAIANASKTGTGGHPKNLFMLTADAWGIMPPIASMTPEQAMYHFLSGYTAKVAGTEKGVEGVEATFSTCFGAPFMPRHPHIYGELLRQRIQEHNTKCWLLNTGWTAGPYGVGYRIKLATTRKMLKAAINGELDDVEMRQDKVFGLNVPKKIEGVQDEILIPRNTWENKNKYDEKAQELTQRFIKNFEQFNKNVDAAIIDAGPKNQ